MSFLSDYERLQIRLYGQPYIQNPFGLKQSHNTPISKIGHTLWLGNIYDAINHNLLINLGIEAIVNVMGYPFQMNAGGIMILSTTPPPDVLNVVYPLEQPFGATTVKAIKAANTVRDFLEKGLNTFVHCHEGVDRSPTIAWRALTAKMSEDEAEKIIMEVRPISKIHRDWFEGGTSEPKAMQKVQ